MRKYHLYTQKKNTKYAQVDMKTFPRKSFNTPMEAINYLNKQPTISKNRQAILFNGHTGEIIYMPLQPTSKHHSHAHFHKTKKWSEPKGR